MAEDDKRRMDWLEEQLVDTIYIDDGRFIDVGRSPYAGDVRAAIDAAMLLAPPECSDEYDEYPGKDIVGPN